MNNLFHKKEKDGGEWMRDGGPSVLIEESDGCGGPIDWEGARGLDKPAVLTNHVLTFCRFLCQPSSSPLCPTPH